MFYPRDFSRFVLLFGIVGGLLLLTHSAAGVTGFEFYKKSSDGRGPFSNVNGLKDKFGKLNMYYDVAGRPRFGKRDGHFNSQSQSQMYKRGLVYPASAASAAAGDTASNAADHVYAAAGVPSHLRPPNSQPDDALSNMERLFIIRELLSVFDRASSDNEVEFPLEQ